MFTGVIGMTNIMEQEIKQLQQESYCNCDEDQDFVCKTCRQISVLQKGLDEIQDGTHWMFPIK